MLELGNSQNATYIEYVTNPTQNCIPDAIKKKTSTKIDDDDAAVAVIRNPLYTEIANIQQDDGYDNSSETQTIESGQAVKNPRHIIYTEVSEQLAKLRREIEAINSFGGFLLGVHDKIQEFKENAEFSLRQVLDVEKHMAELNMTLEIGQFSLARVKEQALKVLRCQENLEPDRVLHLLKD